MTAPTFSKIAAALAVLMVLASCANTIRGVGRDTANAVNATEDAGHKVKRAVQN
jgi:predicted small secreted protein